MTTIKNRILFGLITLMLMASYFVMVYHYSQGNDTPPFAHWIFYTIPFLVGLVLIAVRDEIKIELHPVFTPLGILWIIAAWCIVIFVDFPAAKVMGLGILEVPSEGFWFANGWGILLAFVGLKPLYKRAYYLFSLAFFGVAYGSIEIYRQLMVIFKGEPIEWDAWMDILWLAAGYFALYLVIKKLVIEKPRIKNVAKTVGIFVVLLAITVIVGKNVVGENMLPQNFWLASWLKNEKPSYNITCSGVDCSNTSYSIPYDNFCLDARLIGRNEVESFSMVAQDRDLYRCKYEIDTNAKNLKAVCRHAIAPLDETSVVLPVVNCNGVGRGGVYKL